MKKRLSWLSIVIVASFALKAIAVISVGLSGDFYEHWQIAGNILNGETYFFGPPASIDSSLHMGPIYYYLIAFFRVVSLGNYKIALLLFSLINSLSIYLFYKLTKSWLGNRAAVISTLLFAFGRYFIEVGSYLWNPYFTPLFLILMLYSSQKSNSKVWAVIGGLSMSFLLHLHFSNWLLLPLYGYFLYKIYLKNKQNALISLMSALLILLPYFFFLIRDISMVALFPFFKSENCNFSYWLVNHGQGERCFSYLRNSLFILRLFSFSIFGFMNLFLLGLPVLMIFYFSKVINLQKRMKYIIWLFVPWLVLLFYSGNVYLHHFLFLMPLAIMVFGKVVDGLLLTRKNIAWLIICICLLGNISSLLFLLNSSR